MLPSVRNHWSIVILSIASFIWPLVISHKKTIFPYYGDTVRVSLTSEGAEAKSPFDKGSYYPSISEDGNYIAFYSYATNLTSDDTDDTPDIFLRDRFHSNTLLISKSSSGIKGNSGSFQPSISAKGGVVAFSSVANNLVAGDTNDTWDVFTHDWRRGVTDRVSVSSAGIQGNAPSSRPSVSANGRWVAFESVADNLVNDDTNVARDIFVNDRKTRQTYRVSLASDGTQGNDSSYGPSISRNSRYIAFYSYATNLVEGDTNNVCDLDGDGVFKENCPDIFVHDRIAHQTRRVSISSDGIQANGESVFGPSLSSDGRFVAFASFASNLVIGDTNHTWDVFIHDLETNLTKRVSVASGGSQANNVSVKPCISTGGRYIGFTSWASDLVEDDTNEKADVFVHDLVTGQTARISIHSNGEQGNDQSDSCAIAARGRYISFRSDSVNLVMNDTNAISDIFVHDRIGLLRNYLPLIITHEKN